MKSRNIISIFMLSAIVLPSLAAPKKKAPDAATVLQQGREAFLNYDFQEAADLYEKYKEMQKKLRKPVAEELEEFEVQLEISNNTFSRVQMIEIIDSLYFPKDSFFKNYKLSKSAGSIEGLKELNELTLGDSITMAFVSEDRDLVFWSAKNEDGENRINEAKGLLDGDWIVEESLNGEFEKAGNYIYPFLSQDGQTLYFASDGEGSMGGFDIFMSRRNPFTGEYSQPMNIGMPFNSPANDYLIAVDEENGLGWWATDRNAEEGNVTVYVYILDDVRKNYAPDTENLKNYAKITDYKATQDPENSAKYRQYKNKIR